MTSVDERGRIRQHKPEEFAKTQESILKIRKGKKLGVGSVSTLNLTPSQGIAGLVLQLLADHFLPLSDYNYTPATPSHCWSSTEAHQEFLTNAKILFQKLESLLGTEKTLVNVKSPAYVLGDFHGNYKDLLHFESHFWRLGVKLCPANLVFLGDYVDRGPHSVETLAYICALKLTNPNTVTLLRGNHETRAVNGDIDNYGQGSFKYQCQQSFTVARKSEIFGDELWEAANCAFDNLPVSAIIENKIFCTHGGVPRYLESDLLEKLTNHPRPLNDHKIDDDCFAELPLIFDLLWSDPASEREDEEMKKRELDFAANSARGGDVAIFSSSALTQFLSLVKCTHLIRAHQPAGRVLTVFSSSHYCSVPSSTESGFAERHNLAAAILIVDQSIRSIVLKPQLKNVEKWGDDENFQYEF